eukprot:gnl/MRDRNA2_/MRDRNA2_130351_c0_seq1.p1 gnl/MRDRNA2_/MRDRNA2_130351_c0~~gnl/MRDRNA2_/MRDRNA2_130351_c0_seq1.p1  ORF type:complete len:601 (+),score=38.06 gnl/MRDRNA2_/MRDRNA2_130351_c0_seq1:179-1804(+)
MKSPDLGSKIRSEVSQARSFYWPKSGTEPLSFEHLEEIGVDGFHKHIVMIAVASVGLFLMTLLGCTGTSKRDSERSQPELVTLDNSQSGDAEPEPRYGSLSSDAQSPTTRIRPVSLWILLALSCFQFYVGFLAATWMPFLMAKEGVAIWPERQAIFMGAGKVIYGSSILLNPVFGRISDQAGGRTVMLTIGVSLTAMGLVVVKMCSMGIFGGPLPPLYLAITGVWMFGEAMTTVTLDAIMPEMVPQGQYDIGSGLRSLHFLLGGLCGYVALIVFRDWDFHWIYTSYLSLLFLCIFPTVICLRKSDRRAVPSSESSLAAAYTEPLWKYGQNFARASLLQFIFSMGASSMFFSLLMVRDLCRVEGDRAQQTHFSLSSMIFLVAAALSSVGTSWLAANMRILGGSVSRMGILVSSMVLYSLATATLPVTFYISDSESMRLYWFYGVGIFLGLSYGSVYSIFQSCMWTLLPRDTVDVANAMGFATLCKCLGIGMGNLLAGFVLEAFPDPSHPNQYSVMGYWAVTGICAAFSMGAAAFCTTIEGVQ